MRDKRGKKRGALTLEQSVERATDLIAEHGQCLFIVDLVHSSKLPEAERLEQFALLSNFRARATELFAASMPENTLAVPNRIEKGFSEGLGDASWAAIDDPSLVEKLMELKDREFPKLKLHYGIAADAWSPGIELIR